MVNFPDRSPRSELEPESSQEMYSGQVRKRMEEARKTLEKLNIAVHLGGMVGENAITEKDASDITLADWRLYDYSQHAEYLSDEEQQDLNEISRRLDELKKQYSKKIEDAQKALDAAEGIPYERLEFLIERGRQYANDLMDASNFPGLMANDEIDKIRDAAEKLSTFRSKMGKDKLPKKTIQLIFQIAFYLERLHRKHKRDIDIAKDSFDQP